MLKTYLLENQLIVPSYQHYGGFSGFQDYGINGFPLKNKLMNTWRNFFLGTDIHEVEIPTIMPNAVLKASGHVDRFTDYVVYDKNKVCYRADHLAKKFFNDNKMTDLANQVDAWDQDTLELYINKYAMVETDNGTEIKVQKKNLMIEVPSNTLNPDAVTDFLRPELAQGIFVNFKTYQSYFQSEDSPFEQFGIAQIGKSYRKEISPQSFTRLREFTQAEIEYFVDPVNKSHPDFDSYKYTVIPILTQDMQESGSDTPLNMAVGLAVEKNLISHKLMAYFLAKIYLFAKKIGLKDGLIRFRQHQKNEMAHYAIQCWDLECKVNGSWLECVGCADRGSYDLTAHSQGKLALNAKRMLSEPIVTTNIFIKPLISKMGSYVKIFNDIKVYFRDLDQTTAKTLADKLQAGENICVNIKRSNFAQDACATDTCTTNNGFCIFESSMFDIEEKTSARLYEMFVPNVIEPSFGIDRLIYAILEQNVWQRDIKEKRKKNGVDVDEVRLVLSLPNDLVLYDVAVFSLHKKQDMFKMADSIRTVLIKNGLKCYTDDSGTSIGKKYVRCDEIGVKYVVTVDPGSLKTGLVTIRNRDTMEQIVVQNTQVLSHLVN